MAFQFLSGNEVDFLIKLAVALISGYMIGYERELRHKAAGISTHTLVITGAMIFTLISSIIEPGQPGRIAASIVTGVGFLGAGIIFRGKGDHILNLTTAASIWYSAAVGMAVGFGWYAVALIAAIFSVFVPRIKGPQSH
jgi:putative Mg2+ transporter-C (MgtC) family protein